MSDERREAAGDDPASAGRPGWGNEAGDRQEGAGRPGWGDEAGAHRQDADIEQAPTVPRPPGDVEKTDPNLLAIQHANLPDELAQWLREVAAQVDPRLDRIAPDWRQREQAEAARACVFGLLLGYLSHTYPHVRGELAHVAENHPSFSTLESGSRLATLEQIVADFARVNAWLGPLVDVDDPQRMRAIVE